jgi:hypothetical protein
MSSLGQASGIAVGSGPSPARITVALGYGLGETLGLRAQALRYDDAVLLGIAGYFFAPFHSR